MGNAPDAAADNWQYLYESHLEADLRGSTHQSVQKIFIHELPADLADETEPSRCSTNQSCSRWCRPL